MKTFFTKLEFTSAEYYAICFVYIWFLFGHGFSPYVFMIAFFPSISIISRYLNKMKIGITIPKKEKKCKSYPKCSHIKKIEQWAKKQRVWGVSKNEAEKKRKYLTNDLRAYPTELKK